MAEGVSSYKCHSCSKRRDPDEAKLNATAADTPQKDAMKDGEEEGSNNESTVQSSSLEMLVLSLTAKVDLLVGTVKIMREENAMIRNGAPTPRGSAASGVRLSRGAPRKKGEAPHDSSARDDLLEDEHGVLRSAAVRRTEGSSVYGSRADCADPGAYFPALASSTWKLKVGMCALFREDQALLAGASAIL
ncbi:hypothetical protein HPB47_003738 [Ixodes persulcatus]|uniref:Uncharacterized protein n=1 Tax=Ixodes persulcatus TaxID=34615 RepID=A0AC60PJ95_IXOPE|nr:hypothetical protein HPB47_003738 [Ixodes persulcatus]